MTTDHLVGREDELDQLSRLMDQAVAGRGVLALISGEGGIGKTTLAGAVAARAAQAGMDVLWGRCLEGEGAPPYWAWLQILRDIDFDTSSLDPARDTDQAARFRFFEATVAALASAAAPSGAVVILDDLHWADPGSVMLLRFLVSQMSGLRLLVIGNFRSTDLQPGRALGGSLADLLRSPLTTLLELGGLDAADVASLLAALTDGTAAPQTVQRVHRQSEGNPFFVREIARLIASGASPEEVPNGIRQLVGQRTAFLSAECRDLLRMASVIGREFSVALLEPVSGTSPRAILGQLDEAVQTGLVAEVRSRAGRFAFAHALTRETLYDECPPSLRIELHERIGRALEAQVSDDPEPHLTDLATHFFEASPHGGSRQAIDYCRRAADYAMSRFAYEEAARLYAMALEVQATESAPGPEPGPQLRAALLLDLARSQSLADEAVASLATTSELMRLAGQGGEPESAIEAALLNEGGVTIGEEAEIGQRLCSEGLQLLAGRRPDLQARLLAQMALNHHFDDTTRAASLSQEALTIAERTQEPDAIAPALNANQLGRWDEQSPESRLTIAERLLTFGRGGHRRAEMWGHYWRIAALFETGDMTALASAIEDYERAASAMRDPSSRWRGALSRGARAMLLGRFEEAEGAATQVQASWLPRQTRVVACMQLALRVGVRRLRGRSATVLPAAEALLRTVPNQTVSTLLVCLLLDVGNLAGARANFERLTAVDLRLQPRPHTWPIAMAHLAEAAIRLDDREQATILHEMLIRHAHRNTVAAGGTAAGYGSLARYVGMLALYLGDADGAIRYLEQAVEYNEARGFAPFVALAQYELGRALALRSRAGDRARATATVSLALHRARQLGMAPLVEQCEELLAATGGPGAGTDHAPLSGREAEVAGMVAQGMTNREIAASLHLSPRTAENHVENILNKLGQRSRAEIAAWVAERGLARKEQ